MKSSMVFDLNELIEHKGDLSTLCALILTKEIDGVLRKMPGDKAPGPDGFNGCFYKSSWPIIAQDFYRLCSDFWGNSVDLSSINFSYITLVPKKPSPQTPSDYRPISLMNFSVKILCKVFADRLQSLMPSLVHQNQYGFIKGKSIQDCIAWAFEYIHQCKQSKREIVLLKLDFEKAFDTIEHGAILQVMSAMGFPDEWNVWMSHIFSSTSTTVLLNGVPGKFFKCKRGVRQGDPLSPLLFALGADLLQAIINKAHLRGILSLPIPVSGDNNFPIIQYADDTLIFLEASAPQLFALKALLNSFAISHGLKVNLFKVLYDSFKC